MNYADKFNDTELKLTMSHQRLRAVILAASAGLLAASIGWAGETSPKPAKEIPLPAAARRLIGQNLADIALARCVAAAYSFDVQAATDARASADGIGEWSEVYAPPITEKIDTLVDSTLAKPYASFRGPSVKLDLMKCIDMYHGPELAQQVRALGPIRKRTYEEIEAEDEAQLRSKSAK